MKRKRPDALWLTEDRKMLMTTLNRSRRGARRQRGFTLTELMIALLIMGLIMTVVYKVFSSQDRFFRNQEQVASMQENLRATMEYINQELSWLGYKVPGLAVVKAAPAEIIFQANIPNAGETIQYVRYVFNPSTNTISRAAGAATTDVEDGDLTVMASDMEAMGISYFNILNAEVVTDAADPLCATGIPSAVCAPGTPGDDASLMMVQRVKARVTARTSKPDWMYTDPEGGANPNYRKRRAVLDLRARNIEDVTLQGGQIVPGACGWLEHTITPVAGGYLACRDKVYMETFFRPDPANNTFDDNPSITVNALDMDGNANTNPNRVTYVYAFGDDGTPFNIYDSADPFNVNNTIDTGETRYIAAQELSGTYGGNQINVRFAYSDGVCTQTAYTGDQTILVAPSPASYFYTGGGYVSGGLSLDYTDNTGAPITPAAADKVAMCSSVGNERVLLGAQLNDDCENPITGETIAWDDGGFGGSFVNVSDNGDGTYNATYIPPDSMGTVASVYTGTLTANWGSFSPSVNVDFISADPHDIVIDSIEDVTQAGIFQFTSNVLPRAAQLGGSSGNSFAIERVDGQEVKVRFHFEDACGNYVFKSTTISHSASKGNVSALTNNGDGTYSFVWESNIGCGLEQLNEAITISSPDIANPSTQSETVSFNLLTTRSSDPLSGPFVLMDKIPINGTLQAGNTDDFVGVEATILQYDAAKEYCKNLLAGSMNPFAMHYTLAGDVGGNGSFSPLSPYDDDTETTTTDITGVALVNVYSGTADWDDSITVTAEADIEGAFYSGSIVLGLEETNHPQVDSGFFKNNLFTTEIGSDQPITTFGPGDVLYLQIFDYDENENPNLQESITDPFDVKVTVKSELTGDVEEVGLQEEIAGNSPKFRRALDTLFFPAVATTLEKGDGTLQVRDGDTITMSYEDKDNPADADDWTVYTVGADTFRIFRVGPPDDEILPPADLSQVEVAYGDKLRPELSLPFLAGDGSVGTDTVRITVDSGADSDILILKENGDTGIMVPDDSLYAGKHFSVLRSDTADDADVLATPTTPRYVTLTYDVAGSYAMTRTFFMRDYDLPEVTITLPGDGAIVSGQVTVQVEANDVANATSWGGIGRVELYVNGRFVDSKVGADLTGTNTFIWTTAIGTTPYWLDGAHTLTAKAYDTSLNEATSDPVGVTVANGWDFISIAPPSHNSIWSQDVDVQVNVANLPAESGTHQLFLYVDGSVARTYTITGPGAYNHTVDTTVLPEGTVPLMAIIRDLQSNQYQTTALDIIVDRTAPAISVGSPFDQPWVNRADFPLNVQALVTDANDVNIPSVRGTFSGVCSSGSLGMVPAGGDTFTLSWPLSSCDNMEGVLTITVQAEDVASPPNQASRAFSVRLDTKKPTVDTLTVIPMVNQSFTMGSLTFDGFIRGDVTLQAGVSDGNLGSSIGAFTAWFYNDPYMGGGPPDGTQYLPLENYQSAASGSFSDLWPTNPPPPYFSGIYILAAGVMDSAGNSSNSSPTKVLYLDNGVPSTSVPDITLPYGMAMGPIPVSGGANANYGFLREVEHRFVAAGGDPENPGEVVHSEVINYPASSLKRTAVFSYLMDTGTPAWGDGFYEGYAYATDWAGNTVRVGPTPAFEVMVRYIESASAKINFLNIGPGQYLWSGTTARLVDGTGAGLPGQTLMAGLYRSVWNSCQNPFDIPACTQKGYENWYVDSRTVTTDPTGYLPSIAAPLDSWWTFGETDRALLALRDDATGAWYGYMEAYLGSPQPTGAFSPGDQFYRHAVLFRELDYSSVPYSPTENEFKVSGALVFQNGQTADGVIMRLEIQWNDPVLGWQMRTHDQVAGFGGTFDYEYPAYNLVLPNDTDVYIWLSYYYNDPNLWIDLANLDWLWATSTWNENLY